MRWALVLLLAHVTRARRSKILPVKRSSQDGGYFESCGPNHADEGVHQLVETVKHSEQTSDFCARGAGTVVWPPDGSEKGAFCCPWGATWCGGCAEPNLEGTACKRCRGGWVLDSGHCTACADMAWHDSEGRNCYGVAEASACSGQPFHGLSANTACCACGGGLRVATSFGYYTEPILVGDSRVVGHPLPRTAERYSVDSTCQLLKFNLTLDGTTGELKLAPHCSTFGCGGAQGDFSVTCTITAHEGELSTSAMLRVSGSKWMVWESEALIVPSGSKKIFPARVSGIVPEAALEGEEAQDPPDPPEAAHRRTKSSELTLACLPRSSSDWLELSESGELSVSNEHPEAVELPGLTDLGFTGLQDASGSVCEVQRIGNRTTVLALVPQSWSSIRYPYEAVSVDLNNSLHPALEPQDGGRTPGRVAPSRFSASCATDQAAIRVDFDELTGLATAWGYGIFHLDIQTGSLQISPEANLSAIFDDVLLDQSRAAVRLSCTVLGHYEWQVGVPVAPIKGEIEILVEDSTCWTPALHSPHGWAVVEQMKSSASQCRAACRADATCAVYSWAGKCQFLSPCGPRPVNCQSFPTAVEKIVGCSIGRSCVNLTAETFVWRYGGVFCPVALGEAKGGRLSWVYQKQNMATVEDIIYLQASETDPSVRCGAGGLLLIRSNKSWDFENMTSHYIELFGEHVACLELSGGGNTIQTVFRQGEAQLKVSQATDDVGKNLCLILVPQHCEAPRLLSNAQAEADEEGLLAEAVMIDDPSTSIPNDYSLHPCDCFPVSWGVHSPVTSQSFASVVPGSGNQFTPDLAYLLEGSYMCPQAGYLTHMSAVDLNGCQQACQITVNCSYFWFGSASEVLQCRLYQTCPSLVLLNGASGVLAALVKGQACHRANPEKCWSFSKRREFLGAGTGSDRQLATSSECLFQSLLEECDLMQLIGGLGVQQCSSCAFAPLSWRDTWTQKRRLPETLRGGARLSFTCWAERYRAVPEEPGVPSDPYVAQCAGKHWWGEPFSEPGLHFACGACVQIVPVDYSDFLDQDAQELYFLPNLQVQIGVDQANPLMLTVNGKLFDVTWEPPPEPQLMRLELQSRGAVLRHKGGTGGCLHWIDGKVILSPSCQLWCPRTSVSGCVAREDHVFLCVGAIACLDWQNSTWTVREVPDSPSCPISFQRSTAFAAGPDEASALLQLRHGGMERIAACSEAWLPFFKVQRCHFDSRHMRLDVK
ncbi:Uncharacterized protein SCF082_LOCUS31246 [Durusdinium trenchii]|uniref:Uncharacterized protein n=1 Tax=Durusdinium trenchii TaxID=1381693 RepID=A0ABP0N5J7_9DINO